MAEHSRIVRLPLNRVGTISKITKTAEKLEAEIERSPNEKEIGRQLNMTSDEVIDAMRISRRHQSLNAPFRDGDKNSLIDVIEDTGQIDNTIIFMISDHGEMLGQQGARGKIVSWEESIRVPTLVYHPDLKDKKFKKNFNGKSNLAKEKDWSTEYLDKILSVKIVDGLEGAIQHINKYSSGHTEAIITENSSNFSIAIPDFCNSLPMLI